MTHKWMARIRGTGAVRIDLAIRMASRWILKREPLKVAFVWRLAACPEAEPDEQDDALPVQFL
jgi:hypothetical protein